MDELVVKPADASGGYGIIVGPHATDEDLVSRRAEILENPRVWIAQPTLAISTTLTVTDVGDLPASRRSPAFCAPKLGPVVLRGRTLWVALKEGSLVVNSSQGGGSKDFWVVADEGLV